MSYLKRHGTRRVPQWAPLPDQAPNSAGGFTWAVDEWTRLRRFLILGSEGGTYYASEWTLTRENAQAVERVRPRRTARAPSPRSCACRREGRAPKNDPALFALALAAGVGDVETRQAALEALPRVAAPRTHLFQFAAFVEGFRGWGRSLRRAVGSWYAAQAGGRARLPGGQVPPAGGSDAPRPAPPRPPGAPRRRRQPDARRVRRARSPVRVDRPRRRDRRPAATGRGLRPRPGGDDAGARRPRSSASTGLPREALKPEHLTSPEVWEALLDDMPMTALIRNLATMTRVGVLAPGSDGTAKAVAQLGDAERIRKARVHPIAVLAALRTYASGRGVRGRSEWTPVREIVDALDAAFYTAFENVEPTGKRLLLALDVSGSMTGGSRRRRAGPDAA